MPTIDEARQWYVNADAIHDFDHVIRVYAMAERLAISTGADLEIVRAAVLLHDATGTMPGGEERADHHHASAEFAGQVLAEEGWPQVRIEAVQHCIRAHRYRDQREPPHTIEAQVLFDADKLDVLGAVGVARTVGYALLAGQPAFAEPSQRFWETGVLEEGEPHSAYHEYVFKLSQVKDRLFTSQARALAVERDAYLAGYFARLKAEMAGEL